jgi:hypothetical protein
MRLRGYKNVAIRVELARNAHDFKGPRPCLRCGTAWTPSVWNFYELCETCFAEFDAQKMAGRLGDIVKHPQAQPWFESSEDWMAANPTDRSLVRPPHVKRILADVRLDRKKGLKRVTLKDFEVDDSVDPRKRIG